MKILICGDSFAANWAVKYNDYIGWPNLLAQTYDVTNLAQAGISEYKIWKQISSADLSQFDRIIVSHTGPFRIPIESHPAHYNDPLHKNCDLIYSDIKHSKNKKLQSAVEYFEKFFMPEYAIFMHNLLIEHEIKYLGSFNGKVIHATYLNQEIDFTGSNFISFEKVFQKHRGLINHLSKLGNQIVFDTLVEALQ